MTDHHMTDHEMADDDQPENGALVAVAKLTANRADDLIRQLQGLYLLADVIGTDGARTTSIVVSAAIKGAVHEMREIEWELSNLIRRLTTPEPSSDCLPPMRLCNSAARPPRTAPRYQSITNPRGDIDDWAQPFQIGK